MFFTSAIYYLSSLIDCIHNVIIVFYFLYSPVTIFGQIKHLPPRPLDEAGQGVGTALPVSTTNQTSAVAVSSTAIASTATTTITTSATTATSTTVSSSTTATSVTSTSSNSTLVTHSSYQTRTPPAGYPPLPPGYTLTQPMAPPSSTTSNTSSTTTTTHYPSSTSNHASTVKFTFMCNSKNCFLFYIKGIVGVRAVCLAIGNM